MQFCKDPIWKLCTGELSFLPTTCSILQYTSPPEHCSLYSYLEDLSWVPAETLAEGPTPEVRIGHTATYDPESERIFVFGGSKHKKWFNDVHILDTQSWRWTMVEVISFSKHLVLNAICLNSFKNKSQS